MNVSASRREQAPLSLRYLLRRTRADLTPRCATLITLALAPHHAADDPAQHAVPRDGVPDGLLAPARRPSRSRGRASRCGARAVPADLQPRRRPADPRRAL